MRILLPVDGSNHSYEAARALAFLASAEAEGGGRDLMVAG